MYGCIIFLKFNTHTPRIVIAVIKEKDKTRQDKPKLNIIKTDIKEQVKTYNKHTYSPSIYIVVLHNTIIQ